VGYNSVITENTRKDK